MDRVNRSFLVVATLIAIPTAFAMTTLTSGEAPYVSQAIALESDESSTIQQVAGKQVNTIKTRPGLLQVLSGSRTEGDRDHGHENMPKQRTKGLLGTLFNGQSNASSKSTASTKHNGQPSHHSHNHSRSSSGMDARTVSTSNKAANRTPNADWEGIPYHRVDVSKTNTGNEPIRDPALALNSDTTRIIRGGSNRSIPAQAVSSRRPSNNSTLTPTPAEPLAVPTPPADVARLPMPVAKSAATPTPAPVPALPSQTSSRRSSRRELRPLDSAEIAAASKSELKETTEPALVPRVQRKQVANNPQSSQGDTKPSPKPEIRVQPETEALASPRKTPQPEPNLASVDTPAAVSASSKPTSGNPASAPTPGIATTEPASPNAGIPLQPYAATTPSAAVPSIPASHRSGPPASAFQATQPEFKPTASPVGSGVVPNGEVASYRQQSIPPAHQPSIGSYSVPTPTPNPSVQGRMTTFGLPVAASPESANQVEQLPATPAPKRATAATLANQPAIQAPVQAQPASDPRVADNFSRTDYDGRSATTVHTGPNESAASTSELPGIRVVTNGPSTMMLRQSGQYEIRVENRGSIDATGVIVRATVPEWAELRSRTASRGNVENETQGPTERLVWRIDHLAAGASEQMFVRFTASQSGTFDLDVDWTLLPQKSVTQVKVQEPKLELTIEGPDQVVYGNSQTYKVRVLNPGDGTAANVVFTLSPNSATPQSQRIGDIPPGKEAQFDVELTAQDLGDLQIHGLASADLDLRTESIKAIKVAAAKLEAIFSGPELKYQNTNAMYSLQVSNTGAASSENILASLRLPPGVKYIDGMESAALQNNILKWEIASLPPGATRDYQFRCAMTSNGEHLFAFDCSGTAAGNANVSIATRVESIADLVLTVSDPPAPAPIGSDVTYEIVIHNRGSKEATDVKTIAQFSHGIEPLRIEGQKGEVVTGQVLFDTIPRIGAGQEVRIRVIAKADKAGHHRFRTEVQAGDTVLVAEEATHYMSPTNDRVSLHSNEGSNR
jgi:hypothetical protein